MLHYCLDIGGTTITACIMREENGACTPVHTPLLFSANADQGQAEILQGFLNIFTALGAFCAETPQSIRMAFPGPFDYEKGISKMRGLDKFDALYGLPLPALLRAAFQKELPALSNVSFYFLNDVTAFALGEVRRLHLQNAKRGLFLCIGTGCGSAFLQNGKPVAGECPGVPENGWIYPLPFGGRTIDDCLSKRGLLRLSEKICGRALDGAALAAGCMLGDRDALRCFEAFGEQIAAALAPVLSDFRPEVLVLGGQVMKSAEYFLTPIQSYCTQNNIQLAVCTDTAQSALLGLC